MKFGQMILRRIVKSVATRCQILRLKCTKIDFGWGSAPDPGGGAYSAPPDPLALNRIWSSHSINSTTKFRLYTSIVLSTALHACETCKSTASICILDVFHRRCIRKILGLSWQDRVTNEELMRRSGMQALSEIVQT